MVNLHTLPLLGAILLATVANATAIDDNYIAGYAAGLLKHNLNMEIPALNVQDGVITVPAGNMPDTEQAKVVQLLSEIPGVTAVKVADTSALQSREALSHPLKAAGDETVAAIDPTVLPNGLLPKGHLFKPLLADPRWAHFSASYRNFQSKNYNGRDIAAVSFGETIPLYRSNFGQTTAQWELGLQAGVFSDFNLDASSADLLNTDYIVSAYTAVRAGHFSAFGRLFHQSSHLGDEFLLGQLAANTKFNRVNLSYEGLDLKLSYELPYGVRIYGGGGGIFDKEPSALKIWSTQAGIEFRSPWMLPFAHMRPVIAADIKNHDENNWSADVSARGGVEFDNLQVLGRKLQILAEYYNGYSPSGQFYKDKVEYYGLGAHFYF